MFMRSVVLDFERQTVGECDRPQPEGVSPAQVLFRIHEVGVCGTDRDLAAFKMRRPTQKVSSLVLGHEALGQVVRCGRDVHALSEGDWVVPTVRRGCRPACSSCARGRPDLCTSFRYTERGIVGADGYFTEYAVDDASDLIRVPPSLLDFAILIEPMSVVEKAVARALAVRQSDDASALVLGLGPIGMLASLILKRRGFAVRVSSAEPEDHPRVGLLRSQGIGYSRLLSGSASLIVEAAGAADLALAALKCLAPCGVFVTLGAQSAPGEFSFIDLIVGNQTIVGSVNASRESFAAALSDLAALDDRVLRAMIRRFAFSDYRRTLFELPAAEPKFVHVIAD
jgi:threonine dehydrogenase-like Zn-dependent dehydrogenase